jgi:hypothetical protein
MNISFYEFMNEAPKKEKKDEPQGAKKIYVNKEWPSVVVFAPKHIENIKKHIEDVLAVVEDNLENKVKILSDYLETAQSIRKYNKELNPQTPTDKNIYIVYYNFIKFIEIYNEIFGTKYNPRVVTKPTK